MIYFIDGGDLSRVWDVEFESLSSADAPDAERRDGYNGYGAVDAPFRIAAQKRALRPKGMPKI